MNWFRLEVVEDGPETCGDEASDGVLRVTLEFWRYLLSIGKKSGALPFSARNDERAC
ncbi:MAG: hypothetical protein Tsb0017_09620 [Geothermobacteraceae bacterium]